MVSDDALNILAAVPSASIIVSRGGTLVRASARAVSLALVRRSDIAVPEVSEAVDRVFDDGQIREFEVRFRRPGLGRPFSELRVRVAPMTADLVVVLADDLHEERRVDAVRRDFVANVSHELKTPVGALSLLAEAVLAAPEDQTAVRHFANRMQVEASRLTHLVNDLIDLSRLQSDEPLSKAELLRVSDIIHAAAEDMRVPAGAKGITIEIADLPDAWVFGDFKQITMAVRNLVSNAIAYSNPQTRVALAAVDRSGVVSIDVKDQGVGIAKDDLERVFERFYRVDSARSRATGGTGLGLAIVKHVCLNHGGECRVWSEVGVGSTFTLMLPSQQTSPELGDVDVPSMSGGMST
jgi:two-component system sensor histidine kinase SenX3